MGDIFLSDQEQTAVQKVYSNFLSDVKPDKVVPHLYSSQVFGHHEKQIIDAERTDWAKNDRLYEIVLSRATYPSVEAMRRALVDSSDEKHLLIARMLPKRQSYGVPNTTCETEVQPGRLLFSNASNLDSPMDVSYNVNRGSIMNHDHLSAAGKRSSDPVQAQADTYFLRNQHEMCLPPVGQLNIGSYPQGQNTGYLGSFQQGQSINQQQNSQWNQSFSGIFQQPQSGYYQDNPPVNPVSYSRSGFSSAQQDNSRAPGQVYPVPSGTHYARMPSLPVGQFGLHQPQSNAAVGVPIFTTPRNTALDYYPAKHNRNSRSGNGLCVIISNFTSDLPGYNHDVDAITDIFRNILGYQVLGAMDDPHKGRFQNLNREDFLKTLTSVQEHLNTPFCQVDRFVMFVLSHGDKHGIKTCADKCGKQAEDNDDPRKRVTAKEIVDMFTHDKVPSLYGCPKCFFLQHCRGADFVQAASLGSGVEAASEVEKPPPTAVGADTALFYATNLNCQSYVINDKGSWFVEQIVRLMKQYHDKEHLIDIMGGVNKELSTKSGIEQRTKRIAYQMPSIVSSLTQKFYLTIPGHFNRAK